MAHAIIPLTAPPPKDWSCSACHKDGNAFDLVTHEGCNEKHIFHRMCYPNSASATDGKCQKCATPLHAGRAVYVASDADTYRMRDFARHFRSERLAGKRGASFDRERHKRLVRSGSWDGDRKKPTLEELKHVFDNIGSGIKLKKQTCIAHAIISLTAPPPTCTAHAIIPLTAPPPKGWSCAACHKDGNAFDLVTHEGCNEKHIFHRMCYPNSTSATDGTCQKCATPLHAGRAVYVASDADTYRMRDFARHIRSSRLAGKRGASFDWERHKRLVRSGSWDGDRKKPTLEKLELVFDNMGYGITLKE